MIGKDIKPTDLLVDSNCKTGLHQKSAFAVKTSRGPSLLPSETDCDGSNTLQRVTGRNNTAFDFLQVMPNYKRPITLNFLMQ